MTQLSQVLMNLCVNARDSMPTGGKLQIKTRNVEVDETYARTTLEAAVGPYVQITISDTGTGIPTAIQDRVFEPFFTTKEVNKGTGLGLPTTLSIVKKHDGFLTLFSEPVQGTQVQVFLPASEPSDTVPAKHQGCPLGTQRTDPHR
jgi:signal transduction histidine kinase